MVVANDPDALAEAVNGLLADPQGARRLGQAARADVGARFSLRAYVDRLLQVADAVL